LRRGVARAGSGPGMGPVVAEHPQLAPKDSPVAVRVRAPVPGAWRTVDVNRPDRPEVPDRLRDLVDDYCSDLLDEAGLRELEAALVASEPARRYFAEYWQMHTELGFSSRARRAASAALSRFEGKPTSE